MSMSYDPILFAEKYQLALSTALEETPDSGLTGFELEWNLLDSQFRPLLKVGSGPSQQSFIDHLRCCVLTDELRPFSQLEVFHWMIELVSRPYFHPKGAVYESRVLEAILINALHRAGREFGEQLYPWHGNLLYAAQVGYDSIPGSWNLAKRRYLERCVDLYGPGLATAGLHTNLSLPAPLLAMDFMHLPAAERGDSLFDDYKSQFYITATRLMRAFAALFVATSASTPLRATQEDGRSLVLLTAFDSVRNLTFPNPTSLDLPDLYRSYSDYLQISYDLVRSGVRFGNNNWTPVRARSFAEPVERLITLTSKQLEEIYARGLFSVDAGFTAPDIRQAEEIAHQIEIQNLMARINLPMARVEIRTDDGGGSLELDIANLTLKHLLLLRFYADPVFGRSFRYDREDIQRARRNEELASTHGLRAEIENPLTGKPVQMREFLRWTLAELRPLAEAVGLWEDLAPLTEMASGAPSTAEKMRAQVQQILGRKELPTEVPLEVLKALAHQRQEQVIQDMDRILKDLFSLGSETSKLRNILHQARQEALSDPMVPVQFEVKNGGVFISSSPDKTMEIVELAQQLVRFPSVTACPQERLDEVKHTAGFIYDYLRCSGLQVRNLNQHKYPALLVEFPQSMAGRSSVMLSGHFDVVAPEPDDRQFEPRVEGDYIWGRGAADMKTVVASYMVWMKDILRAGSPYPPINLLLVGNEENGETEPVGTPHALRMLEEEGGTLPGLFIAGERTGERGDELWGEICIQNRGVMRFDVLVHGTRGHTGTAGSKADLGMRLFSARTGIDQVLKECLTLDGEGGWKSQVAYPFLQVGTPGMYNVLADTGRLGVEVRPIPQDDLAAVRSRLEAYCQQNDLELQVSVMENGVVCDPDNPYLNKLIQAVKQVSGEEPRLGKKLPGTSARFAPGGQAVVWGQTGLGPHARDERHFIPSILPYYRTLGAFAELLKEQ
jgi:succinyl-diaminopimelate desuccinylase